MKTLLFKIRYWLYKHFRLLGLGHPFFDGYFAAEHATTVLSPEEQEEQEEQEERLCFCEEQLTSSLDSAEGLYWLGAMQAFNDYIKKP